MSEFHRDVEDIRMGLPGTKLPARKMIKPLWRIQVEISLLTQYAKEALYFGNKPEHDRLMTLVRENEAARGNYQLGVLARVTPPIKADIIKFKELNYTTGQIAAHLGLKRSQVAGVIDRHKQAMRAKEETSVA